MVTIRIQIVKCVSYPVITELLFCTFQPYIINMLSVKFPFFGKHFGNLTSFLTLETFPNKDRMISNAEIILVRKFIIFEVFVFFLSHTEFGLPPSCLMLL